MNAFSNIIAMFDYTLNSRSKRHITGGILLSVSLLFGGLAVTAMTIRNSEEEHYE